MITALAAIGLATPALGAPPTAHTRTVTHHAQAVVDFGDGCAVIVLVTEVTDGRHAPTASMHVNHFCHDGMGSASATLTPDQYDFKPGSGDVEATAGSWHVRFDWDKAGTADTFVVKDADAHTVMHNVTATVTGTITDGVTSATGDAVTMADVASITRRG